MNIDPDERRTITAADYHIAFESLDDIYRSYGFNHGADTEEKYMLQQTLQLLRKKRLQALADEA
ncbi:MAG TPA: hypothetical protein VK528_11225 [Flavobacterium sp.]|nr:hypothetical protein [Flavobacterium sp.]